MLTKRSISWVMQLIVLLSLIYLPFDPQQNNPADVSI